MSVFSGKFLGDFLGLSPDRGPIAFPAAPWIETRLDTGRSSVVRLTGDPLPCYPDPVIPQLDAVALAVAALDPFIPDPGFPVRCPRCTLKRWRVWAPGLMQCIECKSWSVFLDAVGPLRRLWCRRRCEYGVVHIVAGEAGRAALVRCPRCNEERPAPFEVGRYGIVQMGLRPRWWARKRAMANFSWRTGTRSKRRTDDPPTATQQ